MYSLNIKATSCTPSIVLNCQQGKLEIVGKSIPDHAIEFYKPLINSLAHYSSNPTCPTVADFALHYSNTATSKCILAILKILEEIHLKGCPVVINWHFSHEDEDVRDEGETFQRIIKAAFNLKELEEG